jgi:hypothetical protein
VPDPIAAMLDDIKTLTKVVAPISGNEPIVLVASAARAKTMPLDKRIDLSSFVILPSNAVAENDLIAIAPRAIASASDSVPVTEVSFEALLHLDTDPQNIGTPGTPPVVAAPSQTIYQGENIALKTRMMASWAKRDPRAVSWMTVTNW